jgi:hypothetical protein
MVVLAVTTDPMYRPSSESNSEGGKEVYMVGSREELPEKTVEEIQPEADEEIAHAARFAGRLKEGKGTTACRMTRVRRMMSLGMVLP